MKNVSLLDCTLRDGGYINDWRFGESAIDDMAKKLEETKVDIIELGFLKNEPYQADRTVFYDAKQISKFIHKKNENQMYAAMVEVVNPLPIELLERAENTDIDIIRVIVWKTKRDSDGVEIDALTEGYEYCKGVVEKGYKLCVQPARVDQYSDEEFVEMVERFSTLNPLAIYVVDSWGTQNSSQLLHYMKLADEHMSKEICLGYHGHNNLMQAFSVAVDFMNYGFARRLIIDASVYGVGRGAGNLNLELIARYMNVMMNCDYRIEPMLEIFGQHLKKIFEETPWGYSMEHYITAIHNSNPNYGDYYARERKLSAQDINRIMGRIPEKERIIFTKDKAKKYEEIYLNS